MKCEKIDVVQKDLSEPIEAEEAKPGVRLRPSQLRSTQKQLHEAANKFERERFEAEQRAAEQTKDIHKRHEKIQKSGESKMTRFLRFLSSKVTTPAEPDDLGDPEKLLRILPLAIKEIEPRIQAEINASRKAGAKLCKFRGRIADLTMEEKQHDKNIISLTNDLADLLKETGNDETIKGLRKSIANVRGLRGEIRSTLDLLAESGTLKELENKAHVAYANLQSRYTDFLYKLLYCDEAERESNKVVNILLDSFDFKKSVELFSKRIGATPRKYATIRLADNLKTKLSPEQKLQIEQLLDSYY